MLQTSYAFFNRLLNRLNIKYKYIVIIIPCLLISYCSIFFSFYFIFTSQTKRLVTAQATSNMEDKIESLEQYFKNLTNQTDTLLYNSNNNTSYEIQNAFIYLSGDLEPEEYKRWYNVIQKALYDFSLTPNPYTQYIYNAYILTHSGELVSKNTMYSSTEELFRTRLERIQVQAEKQEGRLYYYYDPANPAKLTLARTVYQWNNAVSFQTVDNQVAFFVAEIDLNTIQHTLKSNRGDAISYILLDGDGNPVVNPSELDLDFQKVSETVLYREDSCTYRMMAHPFENGFRLVTLLNETLLYQEIENTIRLQAIVIGAFIILVFGGILFASSNIAHQFQLFFKKIGSVEKLDEGAMIHVDSRDEFAQLGAVYNEMVARIASLNEKIYVSELLARKADLKAFQAQINPHFLYNTLDCINSLVDLGKVEETKKTVTALGNIMRMTIKGDDFLTLRQDMEYVQQYLYIQKMRYQNKVLFLIEIPKNMMDCVIPKLVIQPVLENAIVHGVSDLLGQGMIGLFGYESNGDVVFEIKDNGVGIPDEIIETLNAEDAPQEQSGNGIGLFNTQKRIKLLYGEPYGLTARRLDNGGSCVIIRLPKVQEF